MNEILEIADDLEALITQQKRFIGEIIEENEDILAGLVTSQMERGETGRGEPIRPEYSPGYAAFKGFTTPNLRLEGDFHRSVFARATNGELETDATDEKRDRLVDKYGIAILELSEKSINEFNESVLYPMLLVKNERYLGM